jgi:hypothetical protein
LLLANGKNEIKWGDVHFGERPNNWIKPLDIVFDKK